MPTTKRTTKPEKKRPALMLSPETHSRLIEAAKALHHRLNRYRFDFSLLETSRMSVAHAAGELDGLGKI